MSTDDYTRGIIQNLAKKHGVKPGSPDKYKDWAPSILLHLKNGGLAVIELPKGIDYQKSYSQVVDAGITAANLDSWIVWAPLKGYIRGIPADRVRADQIIGTGLIVGDDLVAVDEE